MNHSDLIENYFTIENSEKKKEKDELAQCIMYLLEEDYADTIYKSKRGAYMISGELHKIIYDPVTKQEKLVINNDNIPVDEFNSLKLFDSMLDESGLSVR